MKAFLVRGVPSSVQMDGWWLGGKAAQRPQRKSRDTASAWGERLGLLVALVAMADVLIWQVATPGISLAIFGMAVLISAQAMARRDGFGGLVVGAVLMLPIVEQVQPLSLAFWGAGLLVGGAWICLGRTRGTAILMGALRLLQQGPAQTFVDMRAGLRLATGGNDIAARSRLILLSWGLPIGLGFVFVGLLIDANPMIESWVAALVGIEWQFDPSRILFWLGITFLVWPFLSLLALSERMKLGFSLPAARQLPIFFNEASVRRSLVLFNVMFAVQSVTDIAFLWGGAALPDGMSYAQYAHRGAYPLLATALLAGVFAVLTRQFVTGDWFMRMVLLIWIGQTILLVVSSLFRLELYVEVYGLTRLRLAAAIWIVLVALGLGLVIWQVLRNHAAEWMLLRAAGLGIATLYASSFLSFDGTIARYNLTHDVQLDAAYICALGPAALPALHEYQMGDGVNICGRYGPSIAQIEDWREWGFRRWRILRSLAAITPLPEGEPI